MQSDRSARFSFVDEGEAVRRLGVSRDELLTLVESKRLRAYPGVGKGNFFRVSDLDALAAELHPPSTAPASGATGVPITLGGLAAPRKEHDPAMKVHLRLQADLKWLDLSEDELNAWVREMHPAAYEKNRGNILRVNAILTHLVELIDAAAAHWEHKPAAAGQDPTAEREKPSAHA
jgi:hypothetical protein